MASVNCSEMIDISETINPDNHFIFPGPVGRVTGEYHIGPSGHDIVENHPPTGRWYISRDTCHYNDVIMGAMASQITSLTIVHSTVYSGVDQRKHELSASLALVRGSHRWPVNSPYKWPVTRKMFPFGDVIMLQPNLFITRPIIYQSVTYNVITISAGNG